jgi:hypothetical protein
MSYNLILAEQPDDQTRSGRAVGEENAVLRNLTNEFKVYAFYYPSAVTDDALEHRLRELGQRTGKNLYINIGGLGDEDYNTVTQLFRIDSLPVIVITALDSLASPPGEYLTAFVRLDSRNLLNSPDDTIQCIEQIFNLFLQGNVAKAIAQAKTSERMALLSHLGTWFLQAFRSMGNFIAKSEITIDVLNGKFEIKHST